MNKNRINKHSRTRLLNFVSDSYHWAAVEFRKKRVVWTILISLSLIVFPLISHALTVEDVPNPQQQYQGWVTDMANILSESTKTQLNQMISELEANNGSEVVVVTVPTTAPSPTPKEFTTELFNQWGIGKEGQDNGVLFLTSVADRRVEIETGYGVEGILPDARVGQIINSQITPKLRQEDWDGGILAGTEALVSVLSENTLETGLPDPSIPTAPVGASSILALGLSLFGYKKAQHISGQPITLTPTGRSQVMGRFNGYSFGLYCWTVLAVFSVSIALILGCFLLDPSRRLWQGASIILVGLTLLLILGLVGRLLYTSIFAQMQESPRILSGSKIFARIGSGLLTVLIILVLTPFLGIAVMALISIIWQPTDGEQSLEFYGVISLSVSAVFSLICAQVILSLFPPKPTFICEQCNTNLTELSKDFLRDRFTRPQQVAQQLNSTRFEGWNCSQCYPNQPSQFHLRRYILNRHRFRECPTCQEFTAAITDRITLRRATYARSGLQQITYQCQSCNYREDEQRRIPRKTRSSSSRSGRSSSGSRSGGGRSGGGGAGGSF